MTPELKAKIIGLLIDTSIYWVPVLFTAAGAVLYKIVPALAEFLRSKSPWASIDEAITMIEKFILALVHSAMDEAEKIKADPNLTPEQKKQKLEDLAKSIETQTVKYAEKTFGDQMAKVLGENPIAFIRGLIERFVREVKARFFAGK